MTLGTLELTEAQRLAALSRLNAVQAAQIDATIRATMLNVFEEFATGNWIGTGTWPSTYTTIVGGGQTQAAIQAAGYYAEYSSLASSTAVETAPLVPEAFLVTAESPSAVAGPLRYGRWRNRGASQGRALNQAARYISNLAAGDTQFAQRTAGTQFQEWQPRLNVKGFRKLLGGAPCGWCITVADQVYGSENVPAHQGDRCGVAPNVDGDGWEPGRRAAAGDLPDLVNEPSAPGASSIPPIDPAEVARLEEISQLPDPFDV